MSLDYGDPYIEWEEENYHRDDFEDHDFEGEDISLEEPEPAEVTIRDFISNGSTDRLNRIIALRTCTEQEAIEFCISAGWLAAEKLGQKKEK